MAFKFKNYNLWYLSQKDCKNRTISRIFKCSAKFLHIIFRVHSTPTLSPPPPNKSTSPLQQFCYTFALHAKTNQNRPYRTAIYPRPSNPALAQPQSNHSHLTRPVCTQIAPNHQQNHHQPQQSQNALPHPRKGRWQMDREK